MAGGHETLRHDRGFERWNIMRENSFLRFKFTARNSRNLFLLMGVLPAAVYYVATKFDNRIQLRGIAHGEKVVKPESGRALE